MQYELTLQVAGTSIQTVQIQKKDQTAQNIYGTYLRNGDPDSNFTITAEKGSTIDIEGVAYWDSGFARHEADFVGTTTLNGNMAHFELNEGGDGPCILNIQFGQNKAHVDTIDTIAPSGINACAQWGVNAKPNGDYTKQAL